MVGNDDYNDGYRREPATVKLHVAEPLAGIFFEDLEILSFLRIR